MRESPSLPVGKYAVRKALAIEVDAALNLRQLHHIRCVPDLRLRRPRMTNRPPATIITKRETSRIRSTLPKEEPRQSRLASESAPRAPDPVEDAWQAMQAAPVIRDPIEDAPAFSDGGGCGFRPSAC